MKIAVLTISDKGSRGERIDKSGEVIKDMLTSAGSEIVAYEIIPDEKSIIEERLILLSDKIGVEIILTTGGTGFSERDVTPEATLAVINKQAPGFAEAMRHKSLEVTSRAMLSRATSGIRGKTIIINLPGSPKAVKECLEVIMPALSHGVDILYGRTGECANT